MVLFVVCDLQNSDLRFLLADTCKRTDAVCSFMLHSFIHSLNRGAIRKMEVLVPRVHL